MMNPENILKKSIEETQMSEAERKRIERLKELEALEPISFEEYKAVIEKWMLVPDPGVLKLIPAVLIANRFVKRDCLWMMLIGPSGGGKTELLQMILDVEDTFLLSLLTPNTLLSGMPGPSDSSLLPKLNGKVILFKDWTSIMSMQQETRNEIYGQLREVYDGKVSKRFGNGKVRDWEGKVGIIGGVTPAYDISSQAQGTLGERFISYRILMPDRIAVARQALKNGPHLQQMRKEMAFAFYAFMKGLKMPEEEPTLPDEINEEIIRVANFATIARSGVIRESSNRKEVLYVPAPEMPTRSVQALSNLAAAFNVVNGGKHVPEDMMIIYRIGLDSVPGTNYMVIKEMARGVEQTTKDIATSLGYPTSPIRTYLENLALLGICDRIKAADSEEGGTADRWTLKSVFTSILKTYEKIRDIIEEQSREEMAALAEAARVKEEKEAKELENLF